MLPASGHAVPTPPPAQTGSRGIFNARLWMATAKGFIGIVYRGACSA